MRTRIACGLILLGIFSVSMGQTTLPAADPATAPAVAPSTQPAARAVVSEPDLPDTSGLPITSLQVVRMAFLQMMPWQDSRQIVADKIDAPTIKRQAADGLDLLAPKITRALMDRQNDTAFVSIAVYRKPAKAGGEQSAVSLTFEGFGKRMDDSFLPRVLSDMPRRPQEGQPDDLTLLVLDPAATSYICFSLNTDGLVAAVMSHKELKRDVAAAVARGLPPPQRRADASPPPMPMQETPGSPGPSAAAPSADYGAPSDYAAWDNTAWWWWSGPTYVPYYVYDLYGYSAYSPLYFYSDNYYHHNHGYDGRQDLYHRLADRNPGRPSVMPPIAGVNPPRDWGRVPRGLVPWLTPRVQPASGLRSPTYAVGRYAPGSGLRLDPSVGLKIDPMGLRVPPPGAGTAGSFAQPFDSGFRGGVPGGGQFVVNPVPPAGIQAPSFQSPPVATPAGRLAGVGPDRPTPPAAGPPPQPQRGGGGARQGGGGRSGGR